MLMHGNWVDILIMLVQYIFADTTSHDKETYADVALANRELKMETFSGRRRPDWQRKPGTKAAVAPRQK